MARRSTSPFHAKQPRGRLGRDAGAGDACADHRFDRPIVGGPHERDDASETARQFLIRVVLCHTLICLASRGERLHTDHAVAEPPEADVRRRAAALVRHRAAGSPRSQSHARSYGGRFPGASAFGAQGMARSVFGARAIRVVGDEHESRHRCPDAWFSSVPTRNGEAVPGFRSERVSSIAASDSGSRCGPACVVGRDRRGSGW